MFKNAKTTVEQGAVGLAAAIFQYQRLGYNVCLPLIDNQDYDLVIEKDGRFLTVQAKTTTYIKNNKYIVHLRKVRHNTKKTTSSVMSKVDFLFILCENGDCYSIPFEELTSLTEIRAELYPDRKLVGRPSS